MEYEIMKREELPTDTFKQKLLSPTFKPILIDELEIKLLKEDERGKIYLLRNPHNSKYIKVHESILEILKKLNGEKSIKDLSQLLESAGIDINGFELVKMLAEEGFIKNIKLPERKDRGDIFSFTIKLFTMTERSMKFLEKLFFFVKSKIFLLSFSIFIIVGFTLFILNFRSIFSEVIALVDPETPIFPLLVSFFMFYIVEFAHEFAHAVTYYHYGGKRSEIGIEFHFFIPFFYASTLDAIWMTPRKQIMIFMAGPLTSLFFAEVFTFLFIFDPALRIIWATHAFFWHVSALITLSPIIRTDGYFAFQAITKFPNLLEHGVSVIIKGLQLLFRKISLKDFRAYMLQYSAHERRILKFYVPLFPIITGVLIYVFVYSVLEIGVVKVLSMTPQILMGNAQGIKLYFLWITYIVSVVFTVIGIIGTAVNTIKKIREE